MLKSCLDHTAVINHNHVHRHSKQQYQHGHTSADSQIEQAALVSSITPSSSSSGFTFTLSEASDILNDCHIGDSICVNGACLTVTEFDAKQGSFKVGLANETLSRTNLGLMKVGDRLNCERAMGSKTRFGGHMVQVGAAACRKTGGAHPQGHVDSTAQIVSVTPDGNSIRYTFQLPSATTLMPYLIEKGYITIDGASLTLTHVDDASRTFGIMLISHSQSILTLTHKEVNCFIGDRANRLTSSLETP